MKLPMLIDGRRSSGNCRVGKGAQSTALTTYESVGMRTVPTRKDAFWCHDAAWARRLQLVCNQLSSGPAAPLPTLRLVH